jgi:hypothetical protein
MMCHPDRSAAEWRDLLFHYLHSILVPKLIPKFLLTI